MYINYGWLGLKTSYRCATNSNFKNCDFVKKLFSLLPNRSEEHTSELQSRSDLVCRLLLEKKKAHIDAGLHWRGGGTCHSGTPTYKSMIMLGLRLARVFMGHHIKDRYYTRRATRLYYD